MKTKICLLLVSALVFFWLSSSWAEEILIFTSPGVINIPEGKVLCKPTEIVASPEIQGVLMEYGTLGIKQAFAEDTVEFLADKEHIYLATLPEGISAKAMVAELNALVDFSLDSLLKNATAQDSLKPWLHATTNPKDVERGLPNDTLLPYQWGLNNFPKGIKAYNAWDITRGDPNVWVGIVDHGADTGHPDLYPRVKGDMPLYTSHGTMVAGVIGPVTNNNRGVAGVDWYSQIKSFSDEPGGEENFSSTLMRAKNAGMKIVNVSISTGNVTEEDLWLMHSAVAKLYNADVFIAAAMGNDGVQETGAPAALWPWAVCAVGGSNYNGSRIAWSNIGWPLDLMAPGGTSTGGGPYDIITTAIVFPSDTIPGNDTLPPKIVVPQGNWTQTYKYVSGCSFAAPYVAGSASLLKAKNPALNNDDLHNILTMSARDMDRTGRDDLTGYGLVNIDSALKLISPPHAFVQGVTTSAPYVVSTSDWGRSFLYDVDGLPPGVYFMRVREVRQVVYFPHPFLSTPHVWIRGSKTDGYLPDAVTYGIKCGWPSQVTKEYVELATYNLEVTTLSGDYTYFLPKAVSDVRLACSALGEMALYAPVNPATEVIRQPQQNKINVAWVDENYGEQGYDVQKQDSVGNWHNVAATGENSQNIADSTVAGSERTAYRVKAWNQERESPYSSAVEVRNAPNAPSEVQVSVTQRPRVWDMTGEPDAGGNGGTASTTGQTIFIGLGKKTPTPDPPSDLVATNEVKVVWEQPKNQKALVTNYQACAKYYMYSGIPGFGGWVYKDSPLLPPDSFSYTFYPLPFGNDRLLRGQVEITVYSIVSNGASADTSFKNVYYITPGNYDAHPKMQDMAEKLSVIPKVFALFQNYPNPFNATTIISYALPTGAEVKLDIYNVLGQKVRTLVNEYQEAGIKKVEWDGKNEDGQRVASGVYLYNIRAGSFHQTRKMGLLK